MAVSPPATSELTAARARALSPLSGATTRTLVLKESTAAWSFGPSAEIMLATAPLASVRGRPDMLPLVSTTNTSRSEERRVGKECRERWGREKYEEQEEMGGE